MHFSQGWQKLPPELRDHVLNFLAGPAWEKDGLSTLSLVSKEWSLCWRPRLFRELCLESADDVRTLVEILSSAVSAWLNSHIVTLTFYGLSFDYPLSRVLLARAPSCRTVHLYNGGLGFTPFPILFHNAELKRALCAVTTLKMSHYSFQSFRDVLRILADISPLEDVQFRKIQWPRESQLTVDATASNVCTGAFRNIRSVHMLSCTDNLAVPAWIFAATSTRYSFERSPVLSRVPVQTWALIMLLHASLEHPMIESAKFRAMSNPSNNSYRFVGSLRADSTSRSLYTLDQVLAEIAVQTVLPSPAGRNRQPWDIHEIAIAEGLCRSVKADYLRECGWHSMRGILSMFPKLVAFNILCSGERTSEDFCALHDKIRARLNRCQAVRIQHGCGLPDARFLEPALFGNIGHEPEHTRTEIYPRVKIPYSANPHTKYMKECLYTPVLPPLRSPSSTIPEQSGKP